VTADASPVASVEFCEDESGRTIVKLSMQDQVQPSVHALSWSKSQGGSTFKYDTLDNASCKVQTSGKKLPMDNLFAHGTGMLEALWGT
jgi:hypothetical protein